MKPIRVIFLLIFVLAYTPTSFSADSSWMKKDFGRLCSLEASCDSPTLFYTASTIFIYDAAASSNTYDLQSATIILLSQYSKDVEKKPQAATPAENEYVPDAYEKESPRISDPLAPMNGLMFQINDKLYFWVLKPVTQGYSLVVPELVRICFSNAYDNLKSPARILNNLLQLRVKRSGNELVRFLFNSVAGVGGFADVSKSLLGIERQEADFGQTLGRYGIGHGLYLVLPILGPSSIRDGIGFAGDVLMYPMTYVSYFYFDFWEPALLYSHEKINDTSFRIGDYESFKQAALDPYVSMRDAFVQYRQKKVEEAKQ